MRRSYLRRIYKGVISEIFFEGNVSEVMSEKSLLCLRVSC